MSLIQQAERQREYRERRKAGISVLRVMVPDTLIADLVDAGWLPPELADCRDAQERALADLLAWWRSCFGADADTGI